MSYYFDQKYYLQMKLAQLRGVNMRDERGNAYNEATLLKSFSDAGFSTASAHYEAWGRSEGLNPNPYFDEAEYLQAKTRQVNSLGLTNADGKAFTVENVREAIAKNGLTPAEHYERFGAYETDADGNYINPSNAFDANAYFQAKLVQLRSTGETVNGRTGDDITMDDALAGMKASGMSPVTHYILYGAGETDASGIPLVQTVPMEERVSNDLARLVTGDTVPTNYNGATLAPSEVKTPVAPLKPVDVGELVSTGISGEVHHPETSAPVPGDSKYVAPPKGLVDTIATELVAPTTTGTGNATDYWVAVNTFNNSALVYGATGKIIGSLSAGSVTEDSGGNFQIPSTTPDSTVSPVHAEATILVDTVTFIDGVANTFSTTFGIDGNLVTPSKSTFNSLDSIYGFNYAEDRINVPAAVTALSKGVLAGLNAQDWIDATAKVAAGQAGLYTFGSDHYLYVNDADPSFNSQMDIVIRLVGISDADAAAMTSDIFINQAE